MTPAFHLPLNHLSFGQVSINLLKEMYKQGDEPLLFTRGEADLSAFDLQPEFIEWLKDRVADSMRLHDRENRIVNLWHINGLLESVSLKNDAFTFHETNRLTETEINILRQQRVVFVSSKYTKTIFEKFGIENVIYCPIGLDRDWETKLHFQSQTFQK